MLLSSVRAGTVYRNGERVVHVACLMCSKIHSAITSVAQRVSRSAVFLSPTRASVNNSTDTSPCFHRDRAGRDYRIIDCFQLSGHDYD